MVRDSRSPPRDHYRDRYRSERDRRRDFDADSDSRRRYHRDSDRDDDRNPRYRREEEPAYRRRRMDSRDRGYGRARDEERRGSERERRDDDRDSRPATTSRRSASPARKSRSQSRRSDRDPRSKSKSADPEDKAKPNFNPSGLLAAATKTVKHADGTGTVLKYHEPPEARKPLVGWRLYVFKGKEQVGESCVRFFWGDLSNES